MPRKSTPSFITEIPLKVDSAQESEILSRFEAARQLYNACLDEAMIRMQLVRDSQAFKIAKKISRANVIESRVQIDLKSLFSHRHSISGD